MASAGICAAFWGIRGYVVKLNAGIRRHPRASAGMWIAFWAICRHVVEQIKGIPS